MSKIITATLRSSQLSTFLGLFLGCLFFRRNPSRILELARSRADPEFFCRWPGLEQILEPWFRMPCHPRVNPLEEVSDRLQ